MDIEKAREWYGKAAGNGDADAREALERLNAAFPQTPSEQPEGVPVWKLLTPPPPLFGDFPPSVRRENLLYYPPTSEPL